MNRPNRHIDISFTTCDTLPLPLTMRAGLLISLPLLSVSNSRQKWGGGRAFEQPALELCLFLFLLTSSTQIESILQRQQLLLLLLPPTAIPGCRLSFGNFEINHSFSDECGTLPLECGNSGNTPDLFCVMIFLFYLLSNCRQPAGPQCEEG